MLRTMRLSIAVAILPATLLVGAGVVSAAAWRAPVPINLSNGSDPSVAMDRVGNTLATWQTNPVSPTPHTIQAARHTFGATGFQQLPNVAADPSLDNTGAIVVVNPAGQGFVAWVHNTGGPMNAQQVQMRTISPGGILGNAQPISTDGGQYTHLSGAINATGDAVIAWTHGPGTSTEAVTRRGLAGAFTVQQPLDTAALVGPSVVLDSGGNALAVWPTSSVPGALEYSRHQAGGGAWSGGGTIHTPLHTYTEQALSGNPNGVVVVAFQDSGSMIDAVEGTVSGGFGPLIHVLSKPIVNPHGPGVNVDSSGAAVVGWASMSGVQYSQHPSGAAFPQPAGAQSITPVPVMANNFELHGNGRGDVIAAWYANEPPSAHNVVRAAVKPPGLASFGASRIISDQTRDTYDDLIAVDENGDAVVGLPLGSSGSPLGVEAAIYDASPPLLGALRGPTRIARGTRASFSTTATDAFSGKSFSWSFGDGSAAAAGASVSHTFRHSGSFTVRVRATDTAGNSTAKQIKLTVTNPPPCRVPRLKGKTLSQAKTLLGRAHCKLGRVHKPRPSKHHKLGKLVVASSNPVAAKVKPNGTKIALTLTKAPKPKHKHKH
jgi:PKD domain